MAKKRSEAGTDEARRKALRQHASQLVHEQATNAVVLVWEALIELGSAAQRLISPQDTLWADAQQVRNFVQALTNRAWQLLPREVLRQVEGFHD